MNKIGCIYYDGNSPNSFIQQKKDSGKAYHYYRLRLILKSGMRLKYFLRSHCVSGFVVSRCKDFISISSKI